MLLHEANPYLYALLVTLIHIRHQHRYHDNILKQYSKDIWSQDGLAAVETIYQQHLQEQRIMPHDRKLILMKPIF